MQQLVLDLAAPPVPTMANFFVGGNGAAVAALNGALGDGERFVYLWGEHGSGKTHLLRAFVAQALQLSRTAAYLQASRWPGAIEALNALAVDDVQMLDPGAQIGLFNLHNQLRAQGGTIAAAADRPAADLPVREDLRSRLGSGVVLQVRPLSDREKAKALAQHATRRGIKLDEAVADHLLSRAPRDMGTLITLVDALDRLSLQLKRPVTLPLAREALKQLVP